LGRTGNAAGLNVLLISVDTLRADHLGCYGNDAADTPNIDALAESGIRFDQAVSAAPITLVSHTTLMTGLDPPVHGVRLNGTFRLSDDHRTIAEILQSNGYATAAVVGAFVLDARYGLGQGFDHYDDAVLPGLGHSDGRHAGAARPADHVTAGAFQWLDKHLAGPDASPFFLWVHYYDPHYPYEPPPPYRDSFADRPYDGEIAFTDAEIGRLIGALRARNLMDDTLIVFVGDHGEGLGEHDEETHLDLIYDSTMRVPLIFSCARMFGEGGVVRERVAGLVDVFPTLLDLLGIDHDREGLDGVDILSDDVDADRAVYIESLAGYLDYGWAALHGLRRVHDKLILSPNPEYFDLRADPGELDNLYGFERTALDLERRLEARLAEWAPNSQARTAESPVDEEALDRLAALGYVRRSAPAEDSGRDPKEMMHVDARLKVALELGSSGDPASALREVEAVLAEYPDAPRALYMATALYDQLGRLEEGEAALRRALERRPKAEGWVHLAWYAFHQKDFETFEIALEEAERLDPLDGGIYISRGHREASEGRLEEALRLFEKALEVDPVRSGASATENIRAVRAMLDRRAGS
jgi:arylsulfatase A-like enzyme/Tfp pilus assembly protein PilF